MTMSDNQKSETNSMMQRSSGSAACSLCEGLGELDGFGGGGRTDCHKCARTGKERRGSLSNGLRHIADDHPCCAPTLLAAADALMTDDLAQHIGKDEALEVVLAIDLRIAEEDFTLGLIRRLMKSLESDMTREEISEELGLSLENAQS